MEVPFNPTHNIPNHLQCYFYESHYTQSDPRTSTFKGKRGRRSTCEILSNNILLPFLWNYLTSLHPSSFSVFFLSIPPDDSIKGVTQLNYKLCFCIVTTCRKVHLMRIRKLFSNASQFAGKSYELRNVPGCKYFRFSAFEGSFNKQWIRGWKDAKQVQ